MALCREVGRRLIDSRLFYELQWQGYEFESQSRHIHVLSYILISHLPLIQLGQMPVTDKCLNIISTLARSLRNIGPVKKKNLSVELSLNSYPSI